MKKILSILLSIISVISIAFAFGGCGDEPVEVRGKLYTMEQAYENGWLNEDDLKSIACEDYDYRFRYEENPYSGMFTSTEKLDKKIEAEIKQAFLKQVIRSRTMTREQVSISKYYGTYSGNIVVQLYGEGVCFDHYIEPVAEVGGVIFKDYWEGDFRVYRFN